MNNNTKILAGIPAMLLVLYLLLLIPMPESGGKLHEAGQKPFAWNRDETWKGLEMTFREEMKADPAKREEQFMNLRNKAENTLSQTEGIWLRPEDSTYARLLYNFFALAPVIAAGTEHREWFITYYNRVRNSLKSQSLHWDMNSKPARNTIYQLLYGMRAAVEEVLLQSQGMKFEPAMPVKDEPSATPAARIFGINVHSGDLLVSRGGAVASALISRGNDYPGNFSHVALIYVDEKTKIPYLVESHIERGVAVSSVEQYVADQKLRFMVLRPRIDLPQMESDPMIPQKAARYIYLEALSRHIPYDFKMNYEDSAAMFCSEVASWAYRKYDIRPWQAVSTISSPGVVKLLHDFGVENFVTLMPSDLEYDPQLSVVAEWRDPQTLYKDHIYNAVMDAMLEKAGDGEIIRVNYWMLPVARIAKAYSLILNLFHGIGPVPEGMSALQGLRNNAFTALHTRIRLRVEEKARIFQEKKGYLPPYWQLVEMAREEK